MNHSSLFALAERSVWDPKIIRKHLIVPQDQLNKLCSIPGWTKLQDNQNTLRLEKDLSIENSQSQYSVNVPQNSQRIHENRELFNKETIKRKIILENTTVYNQKLTRSVSLLSINKISEDFEGGKTLKRSLSLQNFSQTSNIPDVNYFKEFRCKNTTGSHSLFVFSDKHIASSDQDKIFVSESEGKPASFSNIESGSMEAISQLPVSIPTVGENVKADFVVIKENDIVPIKNIAITSDNVSDQTVNLVVSDSVRISSFNSCFETPKESNGVLSAENVDPSSKDATDEFVKSTANADNSAISSLKHLTESCVSVSSEDEKRDRSNPCVLISVSRDSEKGQHVTSVNASQGLVIPSNVQLDINVSSKLDKNIGILDNKEHEINSFTVKERMPSDSVPNRDEVKSDSLDNIKPPASVSDLNSVNKGESEIVAAASVNVNNEFESRNGDKVKLDSFDNIKTPATLPDECPVSDLNSLNKVESEIVVTPASVDVNSEFKKADVSPSKNVLNIPAELPFPKQMETEQLVKNSCTDIKMDDMKSNEKEHNEKMVDLADNMQNNEASCSKKRKLESKNKRSKRRKSEEKQSLVKIRSIKKVGNVSYSVEEVKIMLDIMKELL